MISKRPIWSAISVPPNIFLYRRKQGFVFDLENWVYGNLSIINEFINGGEVVNNLNNKIVSNLSINKSRINALRIWRLFVLEYYLSNRLNDLVHK